MVYTIVHYLFISFIYFQLEVSHDDWMDVRQQFDFDCWQALLDALQENFPVKKKGIRFASRAKVGTCRKMIIWIPSLFEYFSTFIPLKASKKQTKNHGNTISTPSHNTVPLSCEWLKKIWRIQDYNPKFLHCLRVNLTLKPNFF